jgi:RNA polymerase sigma factor (sigma-70 family)
VEFPRLVGALSLYTGDADLAVELAQEALARALRHWGRVERMHAPGAWVHRVPINLANSAFARRRAERAVRERLSALPMSGEGPDLGEGIDVRRAVSRLPRRQRTAVVLRYFVDLPVGEVAVLMRVKEGTVRALTHQGVTALRTSLNVNQEEVRHGD